MLINNDLWPEITRAIMLHGGNFAALYIEIDERMFPFSETVPATTHRESRALNPPDRVKPSTTLTPVPQLNRGMTFSPTISIERMIWSCVVRPI